RMDDLRREVQSSLGELPQDSRQPEIIEISSANAFPTATLAIAGVADDELLRKAAINAKKDIERISGVDRVETIGDRDPEIRVHFKPQMLVGLGVSPVDLANTVSAYFQDLAAGSIEVGDEKWFVRLVGTSADPGYLENIPVVTAAGELPLRTVADIVSGTETPDELVLFNGQPAVLLSVFKAGSASNIQLIEQIRDYIGEQNASLQSQGTRLVLLEDQTLSTRQAVGVMESNALVGLALVLITVWLFLGFRVALLTSIGIPFALGGTFAVLAVLGQTLNSTTLLAVVISLGMLVDDAIVVVESIYQKLRQGYEGATAALEGLREVAVPVTAAVLTTIAAFLPLTLMPGILGDYMRVVPMVVILALAISLVDALWMLPSHMIEARIDLSHPGRMQRARDRALEWARRRYSHLLVRYLRLGRVGPMIGAAFLVAAVAMVAGGVIKVDYFATDLYRLFYINVEMPPGTKLEKSLATLQQIERLAEKRLRPGEARAVISYAGQRFTETEPTFGEEKGQVFVSLNPTQTGGRGVDEIIDDLRDGVEAIPGPLEVSFLRRKIGPPTLKPISVKVRGDDVEVIREAAREIRSLLNRLPGVLDAQDDDTRGRMELKVRLNPDAIVRAGVKPADVIRVIRLYADGEVVASMQHKGERLDVRVKAEPRALMDTQSFLDHPVGLPDGSEIALGKLVDHDVERTISNIRHYDFRRAITVEADIDSTQIDTLTANKAIEDFWAAQRSRFPGVDIDLTGQMDDVMESLGSMFALLLAGLGLIYLILGAQFKSYRQPLMVLATVPMAFTGVVAGLFISGNPLSLYTIYGVVALAGIAVNDAIVLVSTANGYLDRGMSVTRSIVSAARRRLVPILITTLTTMAGLYSLAAGLAGESLMWGPVATAIVWGLAFSTVLTLFMVPSIFLGITKPRPSAMQAVPLPPILPEVEPAAWRRWGARLKGKAAREMLASDAIQDPEQRERYRRGVAATETGDLETAIREFQWLADNDPESPLFNLCAAQALVLFLQRFGWDIGYDARAQRYLQRAQRVGASEARIAQLEKIHRQLKH
ncbi:MAG: efflux RND transporter permease subunit, partial [Chromatiaceae bacterium]